MDKELAEMTKKALGLKGKEVWEYAWEIADQRLKRARWAARMREAAMLAAILAAIYLLSPYGGGGGYGEIRAVCG